MSCIHSDFEFWPYVCAFFRWGANNNVKSGAKPPKGRVGSVKRSEKVTDSDTNSVTLTQEQLTTILASIGQLSNDDSKARAVEITVGMLCHLPFSLTALPS